MSSYSDTDSDGTCASFGEPLTVRRLLDESQLGTVTVVGRDGELERRIDWCLPWDEALLTDRLDGVAVFATAEALGREGAATRADDLAQRGACCLLAHGDARQKAEQGVLDAEDLPVVQLPATASYLSVSRVVAKQSLAQETRMLEYGVNVHRTLGELLYRGAGLPALARQLAKLSACPALILDSLGKVLASEYPWPGKVPYRAEIVSRLNPSLTSSAEADGGAALGVVEVELEADTVACVLAPIVLGRVRYGWIVLVELQHAPSAQDRSQHRVIAEQAVTIVGSEMLRLRSVEEAEERARGDFVHALLHGRFANHGDLQARATHHDFETDASYGIIVARRGATAVMGEAHDHVLLARQAQRVLPRRGARTLTAVLGDTLVVIRQVVTHAAQGTAPASEGEQIAEYANALYEELSGQSGGMLSVAYGRAASGAVNIPASYREARVALGVCERMGLQQVSGYPELRVFAVLADVAASPQGQSFAREVLAPLAKSNPLERAVLAYVEAGGNLNAAARDLSLHRNTMLYKVERASRLLRMDLREADSRFTVWLAHRIKLLDEAQSAVEKDFKQAA